MFAGGTDQFIALLRPDAVAAREHPRRSSRADQRRPIEIRVVGARSPHDGSAAVGRQRDGHTLVGAFKCVGGGLRRPKRISTDSNLGNVLHSI